MPIKIFLSYSHQDEELKEQLEAHLSQLRRDNIIESWNDRKIIPGQKWGEEISEHLKSADIIIFLISPDFICSDYCCDIEVSEGVKQHNDGKSKVVPIVVRPCDWKEMEIGKIQALPKDAKAVTTWPNRDEGWLNVTFGLKKLINEYRDKKKNMNIAPSFENVLTPSFKEWLNDTDIVFKHRMKESVVLDDIFVYPDVKKLDGKKKLKNTIVSSRLLSEGCDLCLILGEEQSGKTSLCKRYCKDFINSGFSPVLFNGENANKSNLMDVLKEALATQYNEVDVDKFKCSKNKIIIVDDIDKIRLNQKHQIKFINEIRGVFDSIIFTASESFMYAIPDFDCFDDFLMYEILLLNHGKRSELIEKWISMGVEETIPEEELYAKLDMTKLHIDSFVRKNVVPPKPLFILSLLQSIETFEPNKLELTSYGHCYQYLIYKSLENVRIEHTDLDKHLNYLTELAFYIYSSGFDYIEIDKLIEFSNEYSEKYLKVDHNKIISNLVMCGLFKSENQRYFFKYKYVYYFYIAKYIAENISVNDKVKDVYGDLLENLHIEKKANIIIFVTHHTKDPLILDEILLCMMEFFDDKIEATLKVEELSFLQNFIDEIPKLVMEQRDVKEEREKNNRALDDYEITSDKMDKSFEKIDPNNILAMVNRAFKSIEIIGQIIRNRHGSLQKSTLVDLAENAYGVGLRFLTFYLNLSETVRDDVIKIIKHLLIDDPKINNEKVEKEAKNIFLFLVYGVIFGVLKKISFTVGSKEAEEIYTILNDNKKSPAVSLISTSIKLYFTKELSVKDLAKTYRELDGNITCQHMFRQILIQHMYMNYVPYKQKQQIASEFGIPVTDQVIIENRKETKLLSR
jgi:hypothetical protein